MNTLLWLQETETQLTLAETQKGMYWLTHLKSSNSTSSMVGPELKRCHQDSVPLSLVLPYFVLLFTPARGFSM